jgi:hypothetical protein
MKAFMDAARAPKRRIDPRLSRPTKPPAGISLQRELDRIGKTGA